MDKQIKYMNDDINRTRLARGLNPEEKRRMYAMNADYRLAEQPATARLLVREAHGMLTRTEVRQLTELRRNLIEINMMCDSMSLAEE